MAAIQTVRCGLGLIKSNIGHAQAAAGVAGVIKMAMALRHGLLPGTLHVDEPSREVDWSAGTVALLTEQVEWRDEGESRRAGVSSFGVSGTNAHVILEQAPIIEDVAARHVAIGRGVIPWVLSGKSDGALRGQAQRLLTHAHENPELSQVDVGYSLAGRSVLEHRSVVLGEQREELLGSLDTLVRGESAVGVISGVARRDIGGIAFLFPGQGSQWLGMGRELYEAYPVFRAAFDELSVQLDASLGCSLAEVVFGSGESDGAYREGDGSGTGFLDQTAFTQAGLFALEVALFRLIESCGVRPAFVMGHSIGELVAAHVAGVLTVEDACVLVAARGKLMGELPEGGAMVSIEASEEELLGELNSSELEGRTVALAAVNGPRSVVLSGEEAIVLGIAGTWETRGRAIKRLRVSHAFHSPLMDGMLDGLTDVAQSLSFAKPHTPVVSNVTGDVMSVERICDPRYWSEHVRQTVRFADGVRELHERGVRRFLELGPGGALASMCHECLAGAGSSREDDRASTDSHGSNQDAGHVDTHGRADRRPPMILPGLRRKHSETGSLLGALAEIWVDGANLNWCALFDDSVASRVALPTYAFQRERYWIERSPRQGKLTSLSSATAEHPLFGAAVPLAGGKGGVLFVGEVSLQSHPWLTDHAVLGNVLLPGAAFLELELYAGAKMGCGVARELTLEAPLALEDGDAYEIQVSVDEPDELGRRSVQIHSRPRIDSDQGDFMAETWTLHATGTLAAEPERHADGLDERRASERAALLCGVWPPEGAQALQVENLYEHIVGLGFEYGEVFQGVRAAWRQGEYLLAEVSLPEHEQEQAAAFAIHPALLDAALHTVALRSVDENSGWKLDTDPLVGADMAHLLFSWRGVELHRMGARGLRVCLALDREDHLSMTIADGDGALVASIDSLVTREISREQLALVARSEETSLFHIDWTTLPVAASQPKIDRVAVVGFESHAPSIEALRAAGVLVEVNEGFGSLLKSRAEVKETPQVVLINCCTGEGVERNVEDEFANGLVELGLPESAHRAAKDVLKYLQEWLGEDRLAGSRCVVVTTGAVMTAPDDTVVSVASSAIWGIGRSAQTENPGRLMLVDLDRREEAWRELPAAVAAALALEESQIAIRGGEVLVPRVINAAVTTAAVSGRESVFDGEGTTLIAGGTGAMGGLIAKHLVSEHGVRSLILASRRGLDVEGAQRLCDELVELGARVEVSACDVADRRQVEKLIGSVPDDYPLRSVVYAAGVIEDGTIGSLTPEAVDRVLAAKIDGAFHLHELTTSLDLSAFVLFSSIAGTFGGPGQGNYSAANASLDALAMCRRACGLPAVSIAWGLWSEDAGMGATLTDGDVARVSRGGIRPLSPERGLELFDAACAADRAFVGATRFDNSVLQSQARAGTLPASLRGLVRIPVGGVAHKRDETFARRLSEASPRERETMVLSLVRREVASVLGHRSPEKIPVDRAFQELGFDSLAAVELRNGLQVATGLSLASTIIFDYPSVSELSTHLSSIILGERRKTTVATASSMRSDEQIAIVGMACRYPGGVSSPEALWGLVSQRVDAISAFPGDRGWDVDALYDPDPERSGTSYVREGGFIEDAADFDAGFFGISPRGRGHGSPTAPALGIVLGGLGICGR